MPKKGKVKATGKATNKSIGRNESLDSMGFVMDNNGNIGRLAQGSYIDNGVLKNMRQGAIPGDLTQRFTLAQKYRDENAYVQAIVDTIVNFGMAGYHNSTPDVKVAGKFFDDFGKEHDIDSRMLTTWENMVTKSNALILVKKDPKTKKVEYIVTLDPELCKVVPVWGKKLVYVRPDAETARVLMGSDGDENVKKTVDSVVGGDVTAEKLQRAANNNGDDETGSYALMKESDGEYVFLKNEKGLNDRLIPPRMQSIFYDISILEMLIDGDSQVAFYTKNVVLHVKGGESITSGQKAGSKAYMVNNDDLTAMKGNFRNVSKALRIFTQHFWKMEYVFPDPKVWAPDKYKALIERITVWSHAGAGLISGTGSNYSISYIKLKDLIAYIRKLRKLIGRMWEEVFALAADGLEGKQFVKKNNVPKVQFDEQALKEPRVLIEELKMLYSQGILDSASVLQETGRSPKTVLARKKKEQENPLDYTPIFEKSQGQSYIALTLNPEGKKDKDIDGNGRPRTSDKTTGIPQPRPSTSKQAIHIDLDLASDDLEAFVLELSVLGDLPKKAAQLWESVYKERKEAGDKDSVAAKKAWSAVKESYSKNEKTGKWTKKKK